jgi:AcrR family transcriptional regulator
MSGAKQTRRRPAEVRRLILAAAAAVFREKGYTAATTDEIAERAGVSASVLHRNFPVKGELFRESALQPFVAFLHQFRAVWEDTFQREWSDLDLMRRFIGDLLDHLHDHRDTLVGLLAAGERLDPGAVAEVQAMFAEMFAEFGTWGAGISRRREWISGQDFDLTFRLMLSMISGAVAFDTWYFGSAPDPIGRDHIVEHMSKVALYGLRLEPAPGADL